MALPTTISRKLVPESDFLPTVTLAPPLELVPSRSLHVQPLAWIPLVISCLIICVTATYVWKLWQREDKYYVEEDYSDEEYEDLEATAMDPVTVAGTNAGSETRQRRPETPGSLIAARGKAQAAPLWSGISRSFAAKTVPLNMRDQAWTTEQTRKRGGPSDLQPAQIPDAIASPPAPSRSPAHDETAHNAPATDEAASHRLTDTWERNIDETSGPNRASGEVIRSAVSEAGTDHTGFAASEYDAHRMSGIDWKDDGSSIQGSEFIKYGASELDRNSYANRYDDYWIREIGGPVLNMFISNMVFTFDTLRDWKNSITHIQRSKRKENSIADVMFTNMMQHNKDLRSIVPSFIAKINAGIDYDADSKRSRSPKSSHLRTETAEKIGFDTVASYTSEDQKETEARPKLTPKGLLSKLGGLERKVSQRLGRNKRAETVAEQGVPHHGRKRTRDSENAAMGVDGAEEREAYRAKKRVVVSWS
ncbi:hypothetical protein PMIN04_005591 [Paraphaeosphaeria minitans]|uniref:Uncharacterized protein n=1 Tax=Paraphaeosphaeria minitans TaxID=565426 RepID=A0A9P6GGT0_9PLEO|nr:hypothetical protein PMIN01_06816 [Paraphaeosphaeria minitans]